MHTPVERIGLIFSGSQLSQVVALMFAPFILKKLGLVTGTAAMLLATALAMGGLAAGPTGWAAAAVFMTYISCQWMSDPGVNTLLMDRVREQERTGAAALMMLVAFGAQFVASLGGGTMIARFGYSALLASAALDSGRRRGSIPDSSRGRIRGFEPTRPRHCPIAAPTVA